MNKNTRLKKKHIIASTLPISAYLSYVINSSMNLKYKYTVIQRGMFFLGIFILIWLLFVGLLIFGSKYNILDNPKKNNVILAGVTSLAPLFIIYVYLPAETFFHNYNDYNFPYWIIVKATFLEFLFLWFSFSYWLSMLKGKIAKIVFSLVLGFSIAVYIQYMFFNQNVGIIDGHPFEFKKHIILASLNILVWIISMIIPVCVSLKDNKEKSVNVISKISSVLFALHLLSYLLLIFTADKQCYRFSSVYFDCSEQYTVGSNKNIVMFIIDEADNKFAKQLYQEGKISKTFDDYIMYTNTCSVYDFTNLSMLQMMTNYPFDNVLDGVTRRYNAWNSEAAKEFYTRFHEAGYKINIYNFDYENSEGVIGKIDNAKSFDEKKDTIQYINYKTIKKQNDALIAYRILPIVIKTKVDMTVVSSPEPVVIYTTNTGDFENIDFYNNINLTIGDSENYLIVQHIKGLHMPDNNVETMDYCMGIVEKYIDQMKELGVYDNASIIITADHGSHDEATGPTWAATPMFMIRDKKKCNNLTLSNAPIYHTDIMPTLLYEAGLFSRDNKKDVELFGKTVFDYKENELRERTWYNRRYDKRYPKREKYNVYYGYTYTGDTETLEKMVDNNEEDIYPVPMNNE